MLEMGCCQKPPTKDCQEHTCSQKVTFLGLLQQGEMHPRGNPKGRLGLGEFLRELGLDQGEPPGVLSKGVLVWMVAGAIRSLDILMPSILKAIRNRQSFTLVKGVGIS